MPPSALAAGAAKTNVTDWNPAAGNLTWTRIDKSTTRALGMIIRLPPDENSRVFDKLQQNVYCDQDGPDRYSIACLTRHGDQDSHVYVPRHYMKSFDLQTAMNLKCMKTKPKDVRDLTPWDRDKRHSIKIVRKWLEKKESNSLDSVHHFTECPECCDEASEDFWLTINLQRGDAHIRRRESLEKRRQMIQKECQERDRLLRDRQLKASAAHTPKDEDEDANSANHSTSNSQAATGSSSGSSDEESRDESDEGAGDEDEENSEDKESSFEEDVISEDEDDENASFESSTAGAPRQSSGAGATTKKKKKITSSSKNHSSKAAHTPCSSKKRRTNKKYFLASSSDGTEAEDGGGGDASINKEDHNNNNNK